MKSIFFALLPACVLVAIPNFAFCASVYLEWDPSPDQDLAGYRVYYQRGSASLPLSGSDATQGSAPVDVANVTSTTLSNLDPGSSYYFAVTAYNSAGVESPYSNILPVAEAIPPVVTITSPLTSSSVQGSATVTASASDNVGVTNVELYVNNSLLSAASAAPYSFTWDTSALPKGSYTLVAKAYDAAGNVGQSPDVLLNVAGDTAPPTVSIVSPANNAAVTGNVTVTAAASDNVGVSKIEIYDNGVLAFASNQNPTSYSWNSTLSTAGIHTLTARAYDVAGNVGQSAGVAVAVGDMSAPVITSFLLPALSKTLTVPVTLSATDNIAVSGYLVSESSTAPSPSDPRWSASAPASFTFSGAGTRIAFAWAKDAAGNLSPAAAFSVVIDNLPPVISAPIFGVSGPNLTASASATDNVSVAKMQLYIDNSLQLETSSSNISYQGKVGKGTHTVTVTAYDGAGNLSTTSSKITR